MASHNTFNDKIKFSGLLITLGIIFGDIGTSPLYVMHAIIGNDPVSPELVLGGLSCVFWTLTLVTTFKYILLALNADNNGQGGIFALFALVRKFRAKWMVFPAIIGCSALLADGIITPAISITSAVEGLTQISGGIDEHMVKWIVIIILVVLFVFQQFGTKIIGSSFGPMMMIWFLMIALLGLSPLLNMPEVLKAINPYYAIRLLYHYPQGFWLLGAVFLCTTGAEALYSDLGHCGKKNIRITWMFVKICLLINYFGQGAYLLLNYNGKTFSEASVFYGMMPDWFLIFGIIIATAAAIIASQALISGAFTLVSEAMKLQLWPKSKIDYPTDIRGQIYIPAINWLLLTGCIVVVLYFTKSANMQAAYGLAIIMDMLMTSTLLIYYLYTRHTNVILLIILGWIFFTVEVSFLLASINKIPHGGWFTLVVASMISAVMYVMYRAKQIRNRHTPFVRFEKYLPTLIEMKNDQSISKYASNLVYMTKSDTPNKIETNIIYSLFNKKPKRADTYWFVHIDIVDEPFAQEYKVYQMGDKNIWFVKIRLGFRVPHKINSMFRQIVDELVANGEVDITSQYNSYRAHKTSGDFLYILFDSEVTSASELAPIDQLVKKIYRFIKRLSLSDPEDWGLDLSHTKVEKIPISVAPETKFHLKRLN